MLKRNEGSETNDGVACDIRKEVGIANIGAGRRPTYDIRDEGSGERSQEQHQDGDEHIRNIRNHRVQNPTDSGQPKRIRCRDQEYQEDEPEHDLP